MGWIASISGLLFGLILAIVSYRKPPFGGILIGMTTGAWVSDLLYMLTFSLLQQHWILLLISALFIVLFAFMGALMPNSWKRSFFIFIISLTGGYLFCWGLGAYTKYFPSSLLLEEFGPKWQYILYCVVIAVIGVIGMILQCTVTGMFDWDTLMDSGLCPTNKGGKRRAGRNEALLSEQQEVEMEPQVKEILKQISDVESDEEKRK